MAESFYGGRRGASVVIVKSYNSVQEMERDFKSADCTVDYDNYVVVNEKINNIESSVLYRRTLDGAVKIGTLGSSSGEPSIGGGYLHLILTTPNNINNPEGYGEYNTLNSLVPGYYTDSSGNPVYNDSIKWVYTNVISEDGSESKTYIGFTFPYPILEFQANMVENNDEDHPVLTKLDDGTHPFYNKWSLNIPKGSKGNSFKNLRVISAEEIYIEYPNGFANKDTLLDILPESQHLIYDYDNTDTGTLDTYYLGKYSFIEDINFTDNGTLSFIFNGAKRVTYENKVKWIKSVTINEQGTLTFTYNNEEIEEYEKLIRVITNFSLSDDGNLIIEDNQNNRIQKQIKWPTKITMESRDPDNSESLEGSGSLKLKVTWNTGESEYISPPINYILNMVIDENYHLLVLYSDPTKRANLTNKVSYGGIDGWADMGPVKSDNGLLINGLYKGYTGSSISIEAVVQSLNDTYPNGLTEENEKGKVLTVDTYDGMQTFFAFDYRARTWYSLGSLNPIVDLKNSYIIALRNDKPDIEEKKDTLMDGGIWFILDEVSDDNDI